MVAKAARDILIRVKNDAGTPAFVATAALRTKQVQLNSETVDVTNSDSSGQFRELLAGGGVKSMSISGGGVASDKASLTVFQDALFDGTLRDGEVVVPNVGTFACKVAVSAFTLAGDYNGEITFEMSLESSGVITFTAEP